MTRTTQYKGYSLTRDGATGNYTVQPQGALRWPEVAVNIATAKRWIECHIAERRNRAEYFASLKK
jgi:hypothetical protein